MKRFVYAGCSFTHFSYPTWGDIIAHDLLEHQGFDYAINLGKGGACNSFIAHQLLVAKHRLNLTDRDRVGVLWSTLNRNSFIMANPIRNWSDWNTGGNVYHHGDLDRSLIETINSTHTLATRSFDAINVVNQIFDLNYQGKLWESNDPPNWHDYLGDDEPPLVRKSEVLYLDDMFNRLMGVNTFEIPQGEFAYWDKSERFATQFSNHPDILAHLEFAKSVTSLHESTIEKFTEHHNTVTKLYRTAMNDTDTRLNPNDFKHQVDNFVREKVGNIHAWGQNERIHKYDEYYTTEPDFYDHLRQMYV